MMKSKFSQNALRNALILSIMFHIFLFGGTFLFSDHFNKVEPRTVSIDIMSAEDLEKLRAAQKLDEQNMKQVVEQDEKSANEVAPDKAKFLSAKNQTVKKETIAVDKGDFQNTKSRSKAAGSAAAKAGAQHEEKQQQKQQAKAHPTPPVKDLFSTYDPAASYERQQKQQAEQSSQRGENGTDNSQGTGLASQTNDYAKDVDKGMETLLNTREFKYYSYYNRIRRQLAQHWEGKVREKLSKMYREKRAPANLDEDRITKVVVTLNSSGTLVNVQIMSDSGLRDLDDAAVEAFRAAAPFPNPPKGIIESDGTVKIRWDFVLET